MYFFHELYIVLLLNIRFIEILKENIREIKNKK